MSEIRSTPRSTTSLTDIAADQLDAIRKRQELVQTSAGLAVSDSNADVGDIAAVTGTTVRNAQARADAVGQPPVTPNAQAAITADTAQGASSFATQLGVVRYSGTDAMSMTAAFMKLDAENLSTNQDIEGYLNLANHYLRQAAFNIERALSGMDPEALLDQADQLEQQAQSMVADAAKDDPEAQKILDMFNGNNPNGVGDAWQSLYDNASREITAAAEADAAGDTAKADAHEAKARSILEAAGIDLSDKDAAAIGKLALEMKAAGDKGNVITAYLDQHPETAQSLLSPEAYSSVKDKGGQAIADAIMAARAEASGGEDSTMTLGLALNAADQETISQLMGSSSAQLQGVLGQVADLLAQAYELRIRAYQSHEALLDAQNAIAEGKTAKGQFGVQDRNMVAQEEILKRLFALTSGQRADLQAKDSLAADAAIANAEAAQLIVDYLQRHETAKRPKEVLG